MPSDVFFGGNDPLRGTDNRLDRESLQTSNGSSNGLRSLQQSSSRAAGHYFPASARVEVKK
jgi:hypothetical protein